jgi:hypothetical protein
MAYPSPFHRLVIIGELFEDTFNTTLSIVPTDGELADVEEVLEGVYDAVTDWWQLPAGPTGPGISAYARITSIKLNRIGTDGRYTDSVTHERVASSPEGGAYATRPLPPQLACVATLTTLAERGLASKGRMYFPPTQGIADIATDGRISATNAYNFASAVYTLFGNINGVYTAATSGTGLVGVASSVGAGMFRSVQGVRVGRVPDTMRSRRNKQLEAFEQFPA